MTLAGVSRETSERLDIYSTLLARWNPHINLVSRRSLPEHRSRHFEDSAQLHDLADHPVDHWVDLGSGGGFPGLIIAILGSERGTPRRVTLVEADARKSTFLRTVIRETGIAAKVITDRIEEAPPLGADILSARALADLNTLLEHAERHLDTGGIALFPKGATWQDEMPAVQSTWHFTLHVAKNKIEPGAVILHVRGLSRA